jgi:hypothetical protein
MELQTLPQPAKGMTIMKKITGLMLPAIFALALASCGGGGGGDGTPGASVGFGNSLPPSTGSGDVENFFPNAQGTSWNYFATATNPLAGSPSSYMDSVTVTGTKAVAGQSASVFLESNPLGSGSPAEGYYFKNDGGVAFLGTNDATDTITPGIVPYIVGLFPVVPGVVARFDKNGLDFGTDLDGDGINETVNVTLTSTIIGFEPLSLGIGAFPRTVKNNEALTGSVVLSQSKIGIPFSSTSTRWSAPGIGVLKTSESTTVQSTTTGETMEARGYTSNGIAHGFDLPSIVAGNLPLGVLPVGDAPALATDGQNFFAASEGASGLDGMLFDSKGVPIKTVPLTSGAGSVFPVAAFDGTNYWVIYTPYSGGTSGSVLTCLAQRIDPSGILVDTSPIDLVTVGSPYAWIGSTAFAFGNANGLLAFTEFNMNTSQHELLGVLVYPDGTFSASFPIATDNSTHLNPAVAFDGSNFFVTWMQLPTSAATVGSIQGVRVSTAGVVLDSPPIAISTQPYGQSSPSVAFDGTHYLVAWLDQRNQTAYPDIYGARVSTAGVLLDGSAASSGFAINAGGTLLRASPRVALNGTEYLVAWTALGYANSGSPGVQAARVSTDGTLPAGANMTIPVSGPPSAITGSQYTDPVMASGSQHGAVIWFDNQTTAKVLVGAPFSPF